ncbi:hypothetical protein QE152_g26142 [Popillia japonica]|uniref:Uncharacterized protein n=1 Tax=Popillia japonica TaxID=7064 RepID=A0AAW1JXK7_POPJA
MDAGSMISKNTLFSWWTASNAILWMTYLGIHPNLGFDPNTGRKTNDHYVIWISVKHALIDYYFLGFDPNTGRKTNDHYVIWISTTATIIPFWMVHRLRSPYPCQRKITHISGLFYLLILGTAIIIWMRSLGSETMLLTTWYLVFHLLMFIRSLSLRLEVKQCC